VVKLRQLVMGWTPLKLKPEPRHSSAESARRGVDASPFGVLIFTPSEQWLSLNGSQRVELVSDAPSPVRERAGLVSPRCTLSLPSREDSEVDPGSPPTLAPFPSARFSPLADSESDP